jgi:Tfp pilus assembly protein PilF
MVGSLLSRRRLLFDVVSSLLGGLLAVALAGCATGKDAQVRALQARSQYELGLSHLRDGNASLGLASLEEAVGLAPDAPIYRNTLGLLYLEFKRIPEALESFREALRLDPRFAEANHNLGVALAESGKWADAVQAYRKALAIPGYANPLVAYHNLGWAYYNLDRLAEAEEAIATALRLEPNFVSAHYHLGLVLLKSGRRDEARAAFSRARDLAPESGFGLAAREHLRALADER